MPERQFKKTSERAQSLRGYFANPPLPAAAASMAIASLLVIFASAVLALFVTYQEFLGGKLLTLGILHVALILTSLVSGLVLYLLSRSLLRWFLQQHERDRLLKIISKRLQGGEVSDINLGWLLERILGDTPDRLRGKHAKKYADLVEIQQSIAGNWVLRHISMGNDIYAVPGNLKDLESMVEGYLNERSSNLYILRAGEEVGTGAGEAP